jgi:hypothetical protein
MALSAFDDRAAPPAPAELRARLGKSARLWEALVDGVSAAHPPVHEEWSFPGAKFGWSLRLKRKERVVLYLIPGEKGFLAGVVLGEKAVGALLRPAPGGAPLPAPIRALLEAAPRYAEGRGLRVPVARKGDADTVLRLVAAKMGT